MKEMSRKILENPGSIDSNTDIQNRFFKALGGDFKNTTEKYLLVNRRGATREIVIVTATDYTIPYHPYITTHTLTLNKSLLHHITNTIATDSQIPIP